MISPKVNRCICHDRTFQDIKEYAGNRQYTEIEELRRDRYCSCSCRMCAPYIELVLKTGETEFEPGAYYQRTGNRNNE